MPCWAWSSGGVPKRVNTACASALQHEAVNVALIGRMLERATEHVTIEAPAATMTVPGRFARDPAHFAVARSKRPHPDPTPGPSPASETILEPGFAAGLTGAAR